VLQRRRSHRLDRLANLRYHHKLWISVLIVLGILVAVVWLAKDKEVLKIDSAYGADDPEFPLYLAALAGAHPTSGNRFEVLQNGDAFLPSMLDAIGKARTRIDFETYIYETGAVADQFTARLEEAARRGVAVNLLVDAFGSKKMSGASLRRLRDAGATVASYGEPVWYKLQHVNYRSHRKLMVVDGRVAYTGGAGIADHWLGHAQDPDHWRDMMVRIEGPIARLLEGAFNENFVRTIGPVTPMVEPAHAVPPLDPREAAFVVRAAATGGSNDLKRVYMVAIAAARRSLDICTPYFMTDRSSRWALSEAAKRGVRIRLLVEGDVTDARVVKYASRGKYTQLLEQGIEIYEYQPTMMHTKAMIVDDSLSMFGSANFDNRSLELNDEMNVVVTDAALAARLRRDFEADLKASKKLELAEWKRRGPLEKMRETVWTYFGEIF
jgi:cardiolipin synthase